MPTDGQQAGANAGTTDKITQLKPPAQLDFDVTNLADSWKRWKQELELYMDLAMNGRDEATKEKLFLYLIGSQEKFTIRWPSKFPRQKEPSRRC